MGDQFLGCQLKLTISGIQFCDFCEREKNFKMNASVIVLFLVMVIVAFASAFPAGDEPKGGLSSKLAEDEQLQPLEDELTGEEERGLRFRRVTCDLLSVSTPWGSVNHAACAAHCVSKNRGYKGGRCKDGVCHCRK